jgi:hypothetical protein
MKELGRIGEARASFYSGKPAIEKEARLRSQKKFLKKD